MLIWAALALPAQAATAYVTNERDNTMSVVDLGQMKTVQTVAVGQRPRGILLTKDDKEILICASDDNTVQVIDRATLKITGTLPAGPDPENFALSVSGNPLYVSNENDNLVTVIDVAARRKIAEIETGVEPEGMAVKSGREDVRQHLGNHQHGAFLRQRQPCDARRRAGGCATAHCRISP